MNSGDILKIALVAMAFVVASCGSKKNLVDTNKGVDATTAATNTTGKPTENNNISGAKNVTNAEMLAKVMANASSSNCLVASIDFNLKSGSKDISVDGKLSMKRDEVIRIQLVPMGLMEVGRMEFTKDSVLIIDRIHKQFLKSSYSQVSFLRNNGIDFNALQALFWNQLFVPGEKSFGQSQLEQLEVKGNQASLQKGKMNYFWVMNEGMDHIDSATATYKSNDNGTSKMAWEYADFKKFGEQLFPTKQNIALSTKAKGTNKVINFGMYLKNMKADSKWDSFTKVSSKYKPVDIDHVINQILNIK